MYAATLRSTVPVPSTKPSYVIFTATTTGKTITSAGKQFTNVLFNGSGGEWILQDNFKATGTTEHYTGIFRSNSKTVDYGVTFNARDNGTVRTLDYTGTDTVRVQYNFLLNSNANTILTMGGAVLLLHTVLWAEMYIDGGGKTFGTVVIRHLYNTTSYTNIRFRNDNSVYGNVYMTINNGSRLYKENTNNTFGNVSINYINAAVTVTDWNYIFGTNTFGNFTITSNGLNPMFYCDQNNTFGNVSLAAGTNWYIANTRVQTLTGLSAIGNCLKFMYIHANGGAATINDANGGTNALDFVRLSGITFGGAGTTWTASNVLDDGGNTGITITPLPAQTYYWIGGAGNWSDPNRWSLSSGGSTAGCVPTRLDHVVFDNNSFPGSNQTVTLNVAAEVVNMTWTAGVNASPNFVGSQTLKINGDLNVAGIIDWNQNGAVTIIGNMDISGNASWTSGGSVTISGNLNISGITNWTQTSALTLGKSITLNSAMTWNQTGNLSFSGTTAGNAINMAGKTFAGNVYFDNPGNTATGAWTLAADFTVAPTKFVSFTDATFISAGFKVDFGDYLDATPNVVKVLNFTGTDTVRVKRQWQMLNNTNATLTMGTAVLLLRQPAAEGNHMYLDGGGKTYHDVVFDARQTNGSYTLYIRNNSMTFRDVYFNISGAQPVRIEGSGYMFRDVYANYGSSTTSYVPNFELFNNHNLTSLQFTSPSVQPKLYLYGSNTINTLALYHGMDVFFGHNQTQTLQSVTATSLCTRLIDLASTSAGTQATLTDAGGTNSLDYVSLKDLKAQGGATWNASNVVDNGNNTGWNITSAPSTTYYWIGGTGNWNDGAHWAVSSGGTAAGCSPNPQDNVVFDNNSFTGTGQSVNLVGNTKCRNMTWTAGVTQNPTFQGNFIMDIEGDLNVLGSMTWIQNNVLFTRGDFILNTNVTWNHNHYIQFYSDSTNNIVNTGGKTLLNHVYFDARTTGSGPKWTLASDFTLNNGVITYVVEGTWQTAGYEVDAGYQFRAYDGTDVRHINLTGTDTIRMRQAWVLTTNVNTTLTLGGATILIKATANEDQVFYGGNRVYKDVVVSHGSSNNGRYVQFVDNNTFEDIFVSFPTVGHQTVYFDNQQNVQTLRVDRYTDYNLQMYYRNGPHTFGNIDINVLGNGPSYHYFQNSAHQFGNYDVQSGNGLANFYFQFANNQFQDVVVTSSGTGTAYLQMEQNTSFAKLDLPKGFDMFVYTGRTQTIGNFIPRSTCLVRSKIRGQNATTSVISQASGTVSTEWITLENHTVQGGATFNATDVTQVGTINGWTAVLVQPITLFWVGGTGNWSDANKWALVSGGPGNGCFIPSAVDNAVFDANSFTATNQTVTMNITGQCKNMIWNNVAFSPTFYQNGNSQNLTVNGDLVVNSPMNWNWTNSGNSILYLKSSVTIAPAVTWNHNKEVRFEPLAGNYTINMGGKTFLNNVRFNGAATAKWTLLNGLTVNNGFTTFLNQGELYSNGYAVDFGLAFDFNNTNTKKVDFTGTTTVKVRRDWLGNGTGTTFVSGGAAILLESSANENLTFTGGNITTYGDLTVRHLNTNNLTITFNGNNTFEDVNFEYTNRKDLVINGNSTFGGFTVTQDYGVTSNIPQHTFSGTNSFGSFVILSLGAQGPEIAFAQNNTFGNLISAGRGTRLKFGNAKTQTINGELLILGTGGQPIFFNSTTAGAQATISKASGNVCLDYVWIKDINATGGATFNAGVNGANLGNNTGINFGSACAAYYWIGGSGNWSDLSHWATSSGGATLHLQLPTEIDDVYFDANSFSATGQTVTFDDPNAECRNMNWFSALYQPTLAGSASDIDIYGSLTLTPFMTQNWTGIWNFVAQSGLHAIDTKGKALQDMNINTLTGLVQISLLNDLKINNDLTLTRGTFKTDGNDVETKNFNVVGTADRVLELGASQLTITNGKWDVQDVTNLTITPGTSKIVVQSEGASSHFYGGGKTYNNLRFHTNTTMSSTMTGSNTFNQLKVEPGVTLSIEAGSTQTATDPVISGICSKTLTIKSTVPGTQANVSKASGAVNASFLSLQDINATGGATFNASQATDNGNNTGWNFIAVPALQVTVSVTNATCPTPNNGTAAAVVTGGVSPFAYLWNTIETTQTLSNLSQGSYTVTVTDGAGCVANASGTVGQPASYNFTATATGSMVCYGLTNGTASVTLGSTAQLPAAYLWSNAATTATATNLAPATYSVTITDAVNCKAIRSAVVGERPNINTNLSVNGGKCLNAPISFTGSGTGTGLQYAWDFGDTGTANIQSPSHTYTAANTYTVQLNITDENNCSNSASQVLTITSPPALAAVTAANASCFNICDGAITLTPSNGLLPYSLGNYEFVHNFDGTVFNTSVFSRDNVGTYTQNNTLSVTNAANTWDKYVYTNQTFARAAGKEFTFSYYHPLSTHSMIGWHGNSTGNSNRYVDLLYAFYFVGNSTLNIFEDGSDRGNFTAQVPGGYTTDTWYEGKIVLKSTGADYYLRKQGDVTYALIYSSVYSTETNLRAGFTYYSSGTAITDNWKVGNSNPATANVCPGTYQYVVTDANQCTATASSTVGVGDATPPTVNCPINQTVNLSAGNCSAAVTVAVPTYSDNCALMGNVLDFDGTNDYFTIPGSFNSNFSSNRITIEGWVYNASGYTPNNCMLAGESYLGDNNIRFCVYLANGNIYAGTHPNNLSGVAATLATNTWVHFAGTYDGSQIRLYLNGTQVASAAVAGLSNGNEEWRIGRRWDSADYFKGKLDEVRIWNVARTAAEINANKNQTISPQTGLVGYYRFNQGVSGGNNTAITQATDASGNNYNGTLQNFTLNSATSNFVMDNPNVGAAVPVNSFNSTTNASGTYPLGTNTVTWSLIDQNNNTGTCSQTITVLEPTPPSLTCPANQTLLLDETNQASLPDYSGLATASDNCPGAVQLVQAPASGSTITGTTPVTVTFTATDVSGNTATCTFDVTGVKNEMSVEGNNLPITNGDNNPDPADHTNFGQANGPTITRTFTIKNTGNGNLTIGTGAITFIGPDAALFSVSNVSLPAVVTGPNGMMTFDVVYTPVAIGIHTATVSIANNDPSDNPYTFDIKAELQCTAPVFTACPATAVTANTDEDLCTADVTYTVTATGTPTPALSYTFTGATTGSGSGTGSGATFNKGNTTVTVTATNACGTTTCVFTVTVTVANPDPLITITNVAACEGNAGTTDVTFTLQLTNAVCDDFVVDLVTQGVSATEDVDYTGIGANAGIVFGGFDLARGSSTSLQFGAAMENFRNLITTNLPGATITNTNTLTAAYLSTIDVLVISAYPANVVLSAAEQTALLNFVTNGGGLFSFQENATWNGSAPAANTSFVAPFGITIAGTLNGTQGVTITNPSHPVANGSYGVVTSFSTQFPGWYTGMGSYAQCIGTLNTNGECALAVIDPDAIAIGSGAAVFISDGNGATASGPVATLLLNAFNFILENQRSFNGTAGQTHTVTVKVNGDTNVEPNETFSLHVKLNGNTLATGTGTILNDDCAITGPGPVCANTTGHVYTAAGGGTYSWSVAGNGTINGSSTGSTVTVDAGTAGTYTVSVTVTDNGCTSSCSQTVTVNTAPTFTACPTASVTANTATGLCNAAVTYTVTASGTPTPALSYAFTGATTGTGSGTGSGQTFNKGNTTVTVTATNTCGSPTCVFTVTVTDNEKPVIDCADDVTINTTTGLCTGTTTLTPPTVSDNCSSLFGNGLDFSGTPNYATLPSGVYFNGDFTIECWVYPKSFPNWARIIDFGNGAGSNNILFGYTYGTSHKPGLGIEGGVLQSTATLPLNQWSHIAATFSGGIGTIYVNGVAAGSGAFSTPVNVTRNLNYVGRSNWGGDPDADAVYDELRIWNVARTQAQIQSAMSTELTGSETGLQVYFPFNQGVACGNNTSITQILDLAPAGGTTNGTLNSFTLNGGCTKNFTSGASDPVSVTNNAPATYPKGNTIVTWTATDASGNTETCQQTVTVTDNQAPVITAPSNQSFNVIANTCAANYTIADPIADNCTGSTWTYTLSGATTFGPSAAIADGTGSGAVSFNKGVTTVTLNGVDAATNAAVQQTFTVTVADNQAPTFQDNSTIALYNQNFENPLITPALSTYCDLSGTDVNSLYGPGWQQVNSVETILINGANNRYNDPTSQGGNYSIGMLSTAQNDLASLTFDTQGKSFLNVQLDLSAIDLSNISNCSSTTGDFGVSTPTLQLRLYNSPGGSFNINSPGTLLATANMTGNAPAGSFTFNWATLSASLNATGSTDGKVTVVFDLIASGYASFDNLLITASNVGAGIGCPLSSINVQCLSEVPAAPVLQGFDNCTANPPVTYTSTEVVTNANNRVITRTWTVTDASSNMSTCTQTVTVTDNQVPVITAPANQSFNVIANTCAANYTIADPIADNCTGSTWTYTLSGATTFGPSAAIADGTGSGAVSFNKGVTTVTLNGLDAATNAAVQKTFTVTVSDNQIPVITCPANQTLTATSAAGATATYTTPIGTDNCPGATTALTAGLASGSTFPIGTTTNTFTVTAANSQTAACSFTVVVSGLAPDISCPANITVNNTPNQCDGTATFAATETTGIPASTITYSHASGSAFPVGTTTVTATATNAVGSDQCTFTVTVVDIQPPTVTCSVATTTINTNAGASCQITIPNYVSDLSPTDNCTASGSIVEAQTIAAGAYNVSGDGSTVVVNYTATDGATVPNTTTCTVTITVNDDDAPTFTCPTPTLVLNTTGNNGCEVIIPNLVAMVSDAADNCGLAAVPVTQSIAAGAYSGVSDGNTIPVTVTVTDAATPANTTTCNLPLPSTTTMLRW